MGVMFVSKTHVQAIVGTNAEVIHSKIKRELKNVPSVSGTVKATAKTTGA